MAGRPRKHVPLDVFVNGRLAGHLRRTAGGAIDFRYALEWLGWASAFPVSLSLPMREDRYVGTPVVAVFDNLLPDNNEIRRRLAARTHAQGTDAFSLLSAVGRDCIGALQFLPEGEVPSTSAAIEGHALSDAQIAELLDNLGQAPLGVTADDAFRISLAGVQEKTALLWWKDRWHMPSGSTPTTHILKPAIRMSPGGMDLSESVENEYLCMRLAAGVGLPAAKVFIAAFGGRTTLVVERFDRLWARDGRLLRLPQEDGCQALCIPPTLKYESDGGPGIIRMLELLKGSDDPGADQRLFLKAQMFFWLLGATDGHAKNFSLHLMPGGRFRLAPLYDILSTQPLVDSGQLRRNQFKLAMAVGTSRHYVVESVLPRHFKQTADAAGVSESVVDDILSDLAQSVPRAFNEIAGTLPEGFPSRLLEQLAWGAHRRLRTLDG